MCKEGITDHWGTKGQGVAFVTDDQRGFEFVWGGPMSKFSWVTSAKKSDGGKAMVRHLCLASRA
jgi:hypothetical protein